MPSSIQGGRDVVVPGYGVRLAATRWPGTGTPVLLLHGLTSQRHFWDLVIPGLAGLPIVAVDLRGHGESERPETGYETATVARDLTTALDALGLSRVVVVGHSWGAAVALQLAADHPERVLSVVAVDGGFTTLLDLMPREEARVFLTPPPPPPGDTTRLPLAIHLQIVEELLDHSPDELLPRLACPCWPVLAEPVLEPGDDRGARWALARQGAERRAVTALATPRLVTLTGAVHDVPLQWPALIAGVVRAAVDEVGPARISDGGGA